MLVDPAGHGWQSLSDEDDWVGLNVPSGQAVHRRVAGELYRPRGQGAHEAFDVAPMMALDVPVGHKVQLLAEVPPFVGLNDPWGQKLQMEEPFRGE